MVECSADIELNAAGYKNSMRKAFDGITYFGSSEVQNDYLFSADTSGLAKRQFKIFYSVNDDKYFLQDLGEGSGTFVRIDFKVAVNNGNVFTFGTFHISVNYKLVGKADPDFIISIQVYDGSQAKEQL